MKITIEMTDNDIIKTGSQLAALVAALGGPTTAPEAKEVSALTSKPETPVATPPARPTKKPAPAPKPAIESPAAEIEPEPKEPEPESPAAEIESAPATPVQEMLTKQAEILAPAKPVEESPAAKIEPKPTIGKSRDDIRALVAELPFDRKIEIVQKALVDCNAARLSEIPDDLLDKAFAIIQAEALN